MKKHLKRLTAVLLALALTVGQSAYASLALGSELVDRQVDLAPGLSLTDGSLWSATYSDLRTEHYLTYTPGGSVTPVLFSGTYTASLNTVPAAAAQLEAQGWRVAAGVNGGFFNTDGTVVGLLMTDGVLRAADRENYVMVGITADGRIFFDESRLTKTAEWQRLDGSSYVVSLAGFNAYRDSAGTGLYLYNRDFSSKVNSSRPCVYAILRPVFGMGLTVNSALAMEVVSVTDTTAGAAFDGVIPEGCYMLYAEETAAPELLAELRSLVTGSRVTVSITGGSDQWAAARYGVSALTMLVRDGQVVSGLEKGAAPRTAIGLMADGTAVFYTIDGRQNGYSIGATYTQVAERLIELGCVTGVALDGGGSTTLGATLPGSSSFTVVNQPSGSLRPVNNSILFLTSAAPSGVPGGFYLTADSRVVLSGSSLTVNAAAYDTAGCPMSGGSPVWSAAGGSIEGIGGNQARYVAGSVAGTYQISAASGGSAGLLSVRVTDSLTALTVTRKGESAAVSELLLSPGDVVELTASGVWYNLPAAMDSAAVTWKTEGNIGTIDSGGRFTAVNDNGTGAITVSAGGRTVTIPVRVDRGDPFTDMGGHWGAEYVTRLYKLGITAGIQQPDGSYIFSPNQAMSRGELLVFLARLLKVDLSLYEQVELPFADADRIPEWALPSVKAMYALQVFEGSANNGVLTAGVGENVTRESAMTMMGRVLAGSEECDLSVFADGDTVSLWAAPYLQTLVARGVVEGNGGKLFPRNNIDRASAAKLLVLLNDMEKAQLELRPGLLTEQEPQAPDSGLTEE